MGRSEHPEYCCFDSWAVDTAARARKRGVGAPLTGRLLAALGRVGVGGKTVLDVGCGVGDLALGTLMRGASTADGIDMSEGAIEQARELASDRGLEDRARFSVGDGATEEISSHDVVALNRVLCCYPSVDRLLANSLGAAGAVYAYTAPVSDGAVGRINRFNIRISNSWFRLRKKKFRGFQAFVHDLDDVDRKIELAGFRRVHRSRERFMWRLAVFAKG
ncbi:MAG TPA: methyltransferase domain-containing protein [Actinomycetota bacterium]|jgi:magnesium-protoporphyrin O-methyltransferase|nr:methyltransferase domain-containing protein [Actinomycetota bacterium]